MEYHVTPTDDLIDHEEDECVCGPKAVAVKMSDGSVDWVMVHHSLDGREMKEVPSGDPSGR